jgi:hypothetical protein
MYLLGGGGVIFLCEVQELPVFLQFFSERFWFGYVCFD